MSVWPVELLNSDIELYAIYYEAKQLEHDTIMNNISNLDLDQFALKLKEDLTKAAILECPQNQKLYFVAFSLGGVILRQMLVNHSLENKPNGLVFVASPLNGSNFEEQVKSDLKGIIPILIPFLDPFGDSIFQDEFVKWFYQQSFPLSKASQHLKNINENKEHLELNRQLLDLKIPFKCVVEAKKTYNRLIGRSYFTVEPHFAALNNEKVDFKKPLPNNITQCS